jgi:hypothetical protein
MPAGVLDKAGALQGDRLKLDLGCGSSKRDSSWIGVDLLEGAAVDVVGDVLDVLRTIGDQHVEEVFASHLLEHLDDLPAVVDELGRVLVRGGRLHVIAPHFSNPYYWSDPTHRQPMGLYTFSYLAEDPILRRRVPTYGRPLRLRLRSVRLNFRSPAEFRLRGSVRRALGRVVNRSVWSQEFYEENLTALLPCFEVEWVLEKVR